MAGLVTSNLDFEILDINNTKNIVFLDTSTYIDYPENPVLDITFPASNQYFTVQIQPEKINVFDSNTIGYSSLLNIVSPADLPDGIYGYRYKICPYDFYTKCKYYLRTTFLDRCIQNIYSAVDMSNCCDPDSDSIKKDLVDLHIFLESAKANAVLGNLDKANKDFNLATKKVDKLNIKLNIQ